MYWILFYFYRGFPRCPTEDIIHTLKRTAEQYNLRDIICEFRNPDVLLQLTKDQGPLRAMPAITKYILNNPSAVDIVQLSTLCQFMIFVIAQNLPLCENSNNEIFISKTNPFNSANISLETQLKVN